MSRMLLCLILCLRVSAPAIFAQDAFDTFKISFEQARNDSERRAAGRQFLGAPTLDDSAMLHRNFLAIAYFQKRGDSVRVANRKLTIARTLVMQGDYYSTVQMALECLPVYERVHDTAAIIETEDVIGDGLSYALDFPGAVVHFKRGLALAYRMHDSAYISSLMNDLSSGYAMARMPDSGLVYAQQAVNIGEHFGYWPSLGSSLATVAENYLARGDYDLALPFLRRSINIAKQDSSDWTISGDYSDLTEAFLGLNELDSAEFYARMAMATTKRRRYSVEVQRAYNNLDRIYEKKNNRDSADHYFRLAAIAKDSLYNIQKSQRLQTLTFREEARQIDLQAQRERANEQRKMYIQFSLVAIGIIALLITVLLLSQSVIINDKWVSFLNILGLLVVFEFVNLLLHPALEKLTGNSPALMLTALVAIGAILIPVHRRLERRIRTRMVAKNKRIRLAAAKKTVERLEGEMKKGDTTV